MSDWQFDKGLHQLSNTSYAYLQPDGGWGWSNAGLVVDNKQSLLVDTLFDANLTRSMLKVMADATGVTPQQINTVVNTHANGDHTHGNGLCGNAEIIASTASAKEMAEVTAETLAAMMQMAPHMGDVGKYLSKIFGSFDFTQVAEKAPTKTFSGQLEVNVGDKSVKLIEVGPAHTQGDVLVHVPDDNIIYTGDILFIDGTPIMWAGPVANWIKACDKIIALQPEVIVPGHGPLTDIAGVKQVQAYLRYIDTEAKKRFDAGLSARDAAFDIALTDYESWIDKERIAVNVNTLYKEYSGSTAPPDVMEMFTLMAELDKDRR